MIFVIYLLIALLVVFAWSFLFLRRDRFEPEPRSLLIWLFLAGAIPAYGLAATINELTGLLIEDGLVVMGVAPVGEEILKISAVALIAYRSRHLTQKVDGAIYGISCGLGFAAVENVGYALDVGPAALGLRSLAVPVGHALFTGVSGYYLARWKFERSAPLVLIGIALAILLHAMWNAPAGLAEITDSTAFVALYLLVLPIEIFVLIRLLKTMSSKEAQVLQRLVQVKHVEDAVVSSSPATPEA